MDLTDVTRSVDELSNRAQLNLSNAERRILYSESELLILQIQKTLRKQSDPELLKLKDQLTRVSSSIQLHYVNRHSSSMIGAFNKVDEIVRLIAVWLLLTIASVFFALPCILLSPIDYLLVNCGIISVHYQISVVCKLFLARSLLRVSGIHLVLEGVDRSDFGKECVLACFTHASSLDAFLLSATIPVIALTVCKAELFLIPYFSWCASAFGGVPINRENRDQAVRAMEAAASAAKLGECMAISPEGTRSLTGQLLEFKKGPFYLWEQLQTPIVPIVTMGAFELFPPGKTMTIPGKVYVRFLEPIFPGEAHTKEEMNILVRTRMLEALKHVPEDVAADLTWSQRLVCWFNVAIVYFTVWKMYVYMIHYDVLRHWNMTTAQLWGVFASVSVLTTLLFYTYAVHCAPIVRGYLAKTSSRKHSSVV